MPCPEAPGHLHLDLRILIFRSGIVGEADVRVAHEAQHGFLVLQEALMQVVRVGLRGPPALPLRARRDVGQFLAALGQVGPVPLAHGQTFGLGQDLGVALVDPVAGLAQQALHQARPAEAVGLDDEGNLAEEVRFAQLVPAPVAGEEIRPAVVDQDAGVARADRAS